MGYRSRFTTPAESMMEHFSGWSGVKRKTYKRDKTNAKCTRRSTYTHHRFEILIPLRQNAHIWQNGNSKEEPLKRDENLRYIRKHGRHQWKDDSGYHLRSLAETIMFRLKIIFDDKLSTRLLETKTTQAQIHCMALNRMTHLGMPQSYPFA
jgi:hypothetical protein